MYDKSLLVELLAARLCHDIAGIAGTIDNCVRSLQSDHDDYNAYCLLSDTTKKLVNLVKFHRYAYDEQASENEYVDITEIYNATSEHLELENRNIKLLFEYKNLTNFNKAIGKIIVCLLNTAFNNVLNNGSIKCDILNNDKASTDVAIVATGGRQKYNQEHIDILSGNFNSVIPDINNCHVYYIYYLCKKQKYNLSVTKSEHTIKYYLEPNI